MYFVAYWQPFGIAVTDLPNTYESYENAVVDHRVSWPRALLGAHEMLAEGVLDSRRRLHRSGRTYGMARLLATSTKIANYLGGLKGKRRRQSVLRGALRKLRRELNDLIKDLESDESAENDFKEWFATHDKVRAMLSQEAYLRLVAPRYYRIATPNLVRMAKRHLGPAAKSQEEPADAREAIAKVAKILYIELSEEEAAAIELVLLKQGTTRAAWKLTAAITGESVRTIAEHCKEHELLDE